jgi:hypothetical protein
MSPKAARAPVLFQLDMKRLAERGLDPVGKCEPWNDDDFTQRNALAESWRIGFTLRNVIVDKRASGRPFEEEERLLRHVRESCRAQMEAWQPTTRQRLRPS